MIYYRVRQEAKKKGITQTKLGQLAQIDQDRMRLIWQGGTTDDINITLVVLERIAVALKVNVNTLIDSNPPDE